SGKIKGRFYRVIFCPMEFELIKNFVPESKFRKLITGGVSFFDSVKQRFLLLTIGFKFYLKNQFHISKIIHIFEKVKFNLFTNKEAVFLPNAKAWGFQTAEI